MFQGEKIIGQKVGKTQKNSHEESKALRNNLPLRAYLANQKKLFTDNLMIYLVFMLNKSNIMLEINNI